MALEFDVKRISEGNKAAVINDEIESLELEQLKQKKMLKSIEG